MNARAQPTRRGSLPATRMVMPFKQGELDGLCGVYAVINALRLALATTRPMSRAEAESLFHAGAAVIELHGQMGSATICGVSQKLWRRIIAKLTTDAAEFAVSAVRARWPFRRRPAVTRTEVFGVIEAAIDQRHPVLVALSGAHSHYTVICGYSAARFILFDSSTYKWIERRGCGLSTDQDDYRHRFGVRSITVLEVER